MQQLVKHRRDSSRSRPMLPQHLITSIPTALLMFWLASASYAQGQKDAHPIYYPHTLAASANDVEVVVGSPAETSRRAAQLHTAMRYEDALRLLDELLNNSPQDPVLHYNRACALARLDRTDDALKALSLAIAHGWQNLAQIHLDPDLQSIRWTAMYAELTDALEQQLNEHVMVARPLRRDDWSAVALELDDAARQFMRDFDMAGLSITLIHGGEIVWSVAYEQCSPGDLRQASDNLPFRVSAPVELLGLLGVLDDAVDHEPGVIRLVSLMRESMSGTRAASHRHVRLVHQSADPESSSAAATGRIGAPRNAGATGRRGPGHHVHLGDGFTRLMKMSVEFARGEPFSRYCSHHIFPALQMERTRFMCASDDPRTAPSSVAAEFDPAAMKSPSDAGLETTAGDVARIIAAMIRGRANHDDAIGPSLPWRDLEAYILRATSARKLRLSDRLDIQETAFGPRTTLLGHDDPDGCFARWHSETGHGIVILYRSHTGRNVAKRLSHLALGGQP